MESTARHPTDPELLEQCAGVCQALGAELGKVVVGQKGVIDLMVVTLLARGHGMLVGVPGLAKTLLVASLARCLGLSFGRVQFTPDLLPADITGTDVMKEVEAGAGRVRHLVEFVKGPIFHNLVLGDEINRTPPKTQAALLEAMQEGRVTVGGATHRLPTPFQVFATRNPIEQEGTYPLPEAQLDRFLLEIHIDYPTEVEEREIVATPASERLAEVRQLVSAEQLQLFGSLVGRLPITEEAVELAVRLARFTRPVSRSSLDTVKRYVRFGAGPRGSQALVLAARARAAMRGEAMADVEDVAALANPALRHRLVLSYRAEADGVTELDILSKILDHAQVKVPPIVAS